MAAVLVCVVLLFCLVGLRGVVVANFFERVWNKTKDVFDGDDAPKAAEDATWNWRDKGPKDFDFSRVNPAFQKQENEYDKQLWFSGGDQQSPGNSWDTGFRERMFEQQKKLEAEGRLAEQFGEKDATGVVTWITWALMAGRISSVTCSIRASSWGTCTTTRMISPLLI